VRNDLFKSPGPWRPAASISRIQVLPMPDMQTQIAQLMTGGVELILDASKDEADQLAKMPNVAVTPVTNVNFHYMAIDGMNRSGNAALLNPDVRKALMMGVDRAALIKGVIAGGASVKPIDGLCAPTQAGCEVSVPPPAYDPNAAKALLAKAGLASGFKVEITSLPGSEKTSEAVAGQLRAIGVEATVDHKTFVSFREKQANGRIQVFVATWSSGGTPDVVATAEYFFGTPGRDYWNDEQIKTLAARAAAEMDVKARTALYRAMFDRMNAQYFFMPISTAPAILIHTRDVFIPPISRVFTGVELEKVRWR
jgi:peptide/nickel transport system substrate-binding protein